MDDRQRDLKAELDAFRSTIEDLPAADEEGQQVVSALNELADVLERLTKGLTDETKTHCDDIGG